MAAQIGYFDSLKNTAEKVFSFLASITLTGTDGKTITCTEDTSLDEAVAMSSKAPKESPSFTGIVTTEGQIAFPAAANPSANVNTLDDYEEGTWTPGISFGGGITGITYLAGYQTGYYTKIGNRVFLNGIAILTSKGTSVGNARLTGLPFTVANNNAAYGVFTVSLTGVTFANQYVLEVEKNVDSCPFYEATEAGAQSALTNTDFADAVQILIMGSYQAA